VTRALQIGTPEPNVAYRKCVLAERSLPDRCLLSKDTEMNSETRFQFSSVRRTARVLTLMAAVLGLSAMVLFSSIDWPSSDGIDQAHPTESHYFDDAFV
jgi:hypothetical protein